MRDPKIKIHTLFHLVAKDNTPHTPAINSVDQCVAAVCSICTHTTAIRATEAAFTACRKAEKISEFRNHFTIGWINATNTKLGRKIPKAATNAPLQPFM